MKKLLSLLIITLTLSACPSTNEPRVEKIPRHQPKPKVALALGGGAAKGFAHIGVIKVLEAEGIKVDIVTGTSAGAVVGSLYAAGRNAAQLEQEALALYHFDLADFSLSRKGLIKGEKLQGYVNNKVGHKPIQSLPRKFAAVATDLDTGEMVVFSRGDTGQAVRASASIPNVFQPVMVGNKSYVDGGLIAPVPVTAARQLGGQIVIAVDISAKPKSGYGNHYFGIFDQMVNIMSVPALKQELSRADVIIRPDISKLGSTNFNQRVEAIKLGEEAARKALPQIRAVLKKN